MMYPVWVILMFFVLPLWVAAGFVDYLCHRASDIEHANGAKESALHWLMLGEVGVPLLAAVFLKVNALIIGFAILCLIAHEFTGWLDLQLAMRTRKVTAFEQQVHSVLEMMPLTALLLLCILHWVQTQALFGLGASRADFSLRLADPPLPWGALVLPALAFGALALVPYAEEFIRGLRAQAASRNTGPD
jgi:hypothetical protein